MAVKNWAGLGDCLEGQVVLEVPGELAVGILVFRQVAGR